MRSSVSLEVDVVPRQSRASDMRVEHFRQRPVSQMFTSKSLDQFFGSGGGEGDDGGGQLSLESPRSRASGSTHDAIARRGSKERWSLRARGGTSPRPTDELLRSQASEFESPPARQRGHTLLASMPASTDLGPPDVKKRSNTFKLGKVLGDMGKGVSNAMASIPLTPRSADRQKERERILAEAGARRAEQATTASGTDDTAKWEKKKKAVVAKGKMNALLHSFGSSGDNLSRHIRKRSVSGKIEERSDNESESESESGGDGASKGADGSPTTKRPGSRIGERAKSFGDLHKVGKNKSGASSPIKKRGNTVSGGSKEGKKGDGGASSGEETEDEDAHATTWNIFGGSLEEVMKFQKGLVELDIPIVLVALTSALIKAGTDQEGIFRVPGNKTRMDVIKSRIAEGDYDFDDEHMSVHDLASLLKEWLQCLKEPVIPVALHDKCLESVSKPKECVAIVDELPRLNKSVLLYIVGFLQTHVLRPEIQKVTRMDIKSVATTFAPCLMRSSEVNDMKVMMANIQQEIKFVVNLLMLLNSSMVGETPGPTAS